MLLPQRKITFTRQSGEVIEYDYVCEINIKKSYQTLTNKAKITIPRKLIYQSGKPLTPTSYTSVQDNISMPSQNDPQQLNYVVGADAIFKRGDQVKIEIGFYPNLTTRFVGYISHVSSGLPITISCEDKMWLLKQFTVKYPDSANFNFTSKQKSNYFKNAKNLTLTQFVDIVLSHSPYRIEYKLNSNIDPNTPIDVGKWLINNITASKVLDTLKDRYGIYSYFRDDGILYLGFANDATNGKTEIFELDGTNGVGIDINSLQWENSEDVKIKVHGVSMFSDNTKIEFDYPQTDTNTEGDTITKFFFNVPQKSLEKLVIQTQESFNYDGFRGKLKTIGEPAMDHGDISNLVSNIIPERNGNYLIKSVEIDDGVNGYFQILEIGKKVA